MLSRLLSQDTIDATIKLYDAPTNIYYAGTAVGDKTDFEDRLKYTAFCLAVSLASLVYALLARKAILKSFRGCNSCVVNCTEMMEDKSKQSKLRKELLWSQMQFHAYLKASPLRLGVSCLLSDRVCSLIAPDCVLLLIAGC